jgi:phosphinothricin acetyltransferase
MLIRPGESGDLARLVDIYNYYITETHFTFDTEPFAVGGRTQWFNQFSESGPYRLLVAEQDDIVVAYASSTQFKPRAAYSTSVETSAYVDHGHTGQGIGLALYAALLEALVDEPSVHRAYGGTALPNPESIALHERLGFTLVGTYREVGFKFDQYWDVSWFEKDVSGASV